MEFPHWHELLLPERLRLVGLALEARDGDKRFTQAVHQAADLLDQILWGLTEGEPRHPAQTGPD